MTPGSNLLKRALKVIASQTVAYYESLGRTQNDVGQDVTSYAEPKQIKGSFQPVSQDLYEINGLDMQKQYFWFYVSLDIIDINRDTSGDQIEFNGQRFQAESNTDWFNIDGWKAILFIRVVNP